MLDPLLLSLPSSRRAFLQTMATGCIAMGTQLHAADAIVRNGHPYMKLSLAAYSFRSLLTQSWPQSRGKPGSLKMSDFIDFCAAQNLDGVELTSYYFPNPLTDEELMSIKEQTFRLGLDISGTAIGNDFCLPDGPKRDEQLALCKQWIDYAAIMGAPVIRIFAGRVPSGTSEEAALDQCVAGINECLKHAARRGVSLALENHGGITSTASQLLSIVKRVDSSPWFGVNFDSGNFHSADPYSELEQIAPYAINAQIKVSMKPTGQSRQPADFARIVEILKTAGYRGYLVLEYEEKEDPRTAIPKFLDQLRELIA